MAAARAPVAAAALTLLGACSGLTGPSDYPSLADIPEPPGDVSSPADIERVVATLSALRLEAEQASEDAPVE